MDATDENLLVYQTILITWWLEGGARSFSWREDENRVPYRAVVAEMMLRRTRADQVERVYRAFLNQYPTLASVLEADTEEIRRLLYPLGLAWRAENFVSLFEAVRMQGMTDFPTDISSLQSLPGIGDYVSNAVACFAGGDTSATLIDTNVVRVLGRVFGIDTTGEARRRVGVRTLAQRAVDRTRAGDYHYAILDFAALVCTARTPRCPSCPFGQSGRCDYYNEITESNRIERRT
jgi:A/G-specific adenine glycosylase